MFKVYLAGSILGCTEKEAKAWRQMVKNSGILKGITFLDPTDSLAPLPDGEVYGLEEEPYEVHSSSAYVMRDIYQIKSCDVMVFKRDRNYRQEGGLIECGIAIALGKPLIVYDPSDEICHPFLERNALVVNSLFFLITALESYYEPLKPKA